MNDHGLMDQIKGLQIAEILKETNNQRPPMELNAGIIYVPNEGHPDFWREVAQRIRLSNGATLPTTVPHNGNPNAFATADALLQEHSMACRRDGAWDSNTVRRMLAEAFERGQTVG